MGVYGVGASQWWIGSEWSHSAQRQQKGSESASTAVERHQLAHTPTRAHTHLILLLFVLATGIVVLETLHALSIDHSTVGELINRLLN